MGQRAVYRDSEGATYSASIVFSEGRWVMVTSDGLQEITYYFNDDDAGRLEFVQYRDEPDTDADTRLHLPEPIGTETPMQLVQRAYAEQVVGEQRKARLQIRNEMQADPSAAYARQTRRLSNEFARLKKPHS